MTEQNAPAKCPTCWSFERDKRFHVGKPGQTAMVECDDDWHRQREGPPQFERGLSGHYAEYLSTHIRTPEECPTCLRIKKQMEDQIAERAGEQQELFHLEGLLEKKEAEIKRLGLALSEAAQEINCAGPVDHRIRILKKEYEDRIQQLKTALEGLLQADGHSTDCKFTGCTCGSAAKYKIVRASAVDLIRR